MKLFYTQKGIDDNYVLKIDGANFIIFEKITIQSTSDTIFSNVVVLNMADYNTFKNNVIQGVYSNGGAAPVFFTCGSSNNYNTFENNKILYGAYGFFLNSCTPTISSIGNVIRNNIITGFSLIGIASLRQDFIQIYNNTMTALQGATYCYCIECAVNNNPKVINNKILLDVKSGYGITIDNCVGTESNYVLVANNAI